MQFHTKYIKIMQQCSHIPPYSTSCPQNVVVCSEVDAPTTCKFVDLGSGWPLHQLWPRGTSPLDITTRCYIAPTALAWTEATNEGLAAQFAKHQDIWSTCMVLLQLLRSQLTIAPNFFSKLTKLKTKFGISCFKEGVNTILKSRYHPVLCVSYLVFALVFLENLKFGLQFG